MAETVRSDAPAQSTQVFDFPDRRLFWKWVWSAVRPVLGWVLAAAGAIALFIGWFGVSGESLTAKQLPYLVSAGLSGIALFIMAGVFLATDDVRRQFDRLGELERKVDDLYSLFVADIAAARPQAGPPVDLGAAGSESPGALVALPTGTSYHQSDCALVEGKEQAAGVSADDIARRGLRPCRVCEPPAPTRD